MTEPDSNSRAGQVARALLAGLALVLGFAGQFTLTSSPEWLWPGLGLFAAALLLFVRATSGKSPVALGLWMDRRGITLTVVGAALAALMSTLAALMSAAFEVLGRVNYLPILLLLAAAGIIYLGAFVVAWRPPAAWRVRLRQQRTEFILLGLIVLLGAGLRFYRLGDLPRVIDGDEGLLGQSAVGAYELPLANPFSLFENFGGLYMQGIGLAVGYFGRTPFSLRLLPAIGGTLAIPALFLLGRRLFGARVGLLAAFLVAVAHAHIHFSRTVAVGYIQGTWLGPLIAFLFISGLQNRSGLRLAAGGLLLGAYFSVYLGAQVLAAYLLVYLLVAAIVDRALIFGAARKIPIFWFGALLTGLPQAVYSLRHPNQFFARLNSDGTFQSGWLAREVLATGHSAVQVLLQRVSHAFLSLNFYPAADFYGAPGPVLEILTAVLFVLGLGVALARTRDFRYLFLNGYFWAATAAVGLFAIPPTADSYRMLVAVPAALLFAAIGWERLAALAADTMSNRRLAWNSLVALVAVALVISNLRTYFFDFAGNCRFGGDVQTRFASYLGNYVRALAPDDRIYLLSSPDIRYGTHSSVDFLSNNRPVTNVDEPAEGLAAVSEQAVVAVAARADELRAWADAHPGGAYREVFDCQQLMLVAYRLP